MGMPGPIEMIILAVVAVGILAAAGAAIWWVLGRGGRDE